MSTIAIILAADAGEGFEHPKYTTLIDEKPLLQHVVDAASEWPTDEVVVVIGSDSEAILETIDFGNLVVIVDPGWEEGSASPLRAALDLASRNRDHTRCLVARGDQPGVTAEMVGLLLDAAESEEADAAAPRYRYSIGWPVVLDRGLWDHLLGGEGSVDAVDIAKSHASSLAEVWFDHLPPKAYKNLDDLWSL